MIVTTNQFRMHLFLMGHIDAINTKENMKVQCLQLLCSPVLLQEPLTPPGGKAIGAVHHVGLVVYQNEEVTLLCI